APAATADSRSVHGHARSVQGQARLADVDLEDLPGVRVVARLQVAVRDEQLVAEERETQRRVEARVGDPPDLVAGRVQHRDLVRAEQTDVEVARPGEGEAGRLRPRDGRVGRRD